MYFFGYSEKSNVYHPMHTHDRKIVIFKDVIFNESFVTCQEDQYLQKMLKEKK